MRFEAFTEMTCTLVMETVGSSETLVTTYQTTPRHNPEKHNFLKALFKSFC